MTAHKIRAGRQQSCRGLAVQQLRDALGRVPPAWFGRRPLSASSPQNGLRAAAAQERCQDHATMRHQCKQPVDPLHIAAQRPVVGRHRALGSAYGPQRWYLREPQQLSDLVARAGGKRGQAGFTRARIVRGRTRPEASGCGLCFAVSDTGIGIDLDRGIGIFWRLPANAGGKRQHRIGAVHCTTYSLGDRGSLSVTSTAGAGTTFSFSFLAPVTEGPGQSGPFWHEHRCSLPSRREMLHQPRTPCRQTRLWRNSPIWRFRAT